jgi:hypothetical protein
MFLPCLYFDAYFLQDINRRSELHYLIHPERFAETALIDLRDIIPYLESKTNHYFSTVRESVFKIIQEYLSGQRSLISNSPGVPDGKLFIPSSAPARGSVELEDNTSSGAAELRPSSVQDPVAINQDDLRSVDESMINSDPERKRKLIDLEIEERELSAQRLKLDNERLKLDNERLALDNEERRLDFQKRAVSLAERIVALH